MPMLTDADKAKKLSEYLGITGTDAEIQKKMEDSEAARDVINQIFEFKADNLFHNRKPYPFVVEKLAGMTLEGIERNKETLLGDLKKYYEEMWDDYKQPYDGEAKREPFLKATEYESVTDGDKKGYFFKFWRSPLTKLLAYRGIDPSTTDGQEKAKKILEKVFGPETSKYDFSTLISYTPKFLVEQKGDIEKDNRAKREREEVEKELLKTKPFHETLTQLDNIHFSDNDPAIMAHEAFLQPDAHTRLKGLMRTKEKLDEETFKEYIMKTPQQIGQAAEEVRKDPLVLWPITIRNDQQFLTTNPGKTFAELLHRDGRPELPFGEDAKNAVMRGTLRNLLGKGPVDDKAVKKAMDRPLSELVADADKIVADVQKRGKRNKILIMGSILLATTATALGLMKAYNSISNAFDSQPAPTPAPAVQKADQTQKAGISGALAAVSNQVVATQAAVATNATPQQIAKPAMPQKGNRLVALQWSGYKDRICRTIEPQAAEWLINGEFEYRFHEIRTKGMPFGDLYDRDFMSKALGRLDNVVNVGGVPGHTPIKFYLKRDGGRSGQALVQDMLNWYDNMNDALGTLPVSRENLVQAQLKTMDAIGPSLGWSTKQQMGWLNANPDLAKHAKENIAALTAAGIAERKVDTNNVEAVFMETVNAASIYRQSNPQAQGLMLIIDETVRKVANIEMEDMAKFDKVQKPQEVIKPRQDSAVKSTEPQQKTKVVVKKERYGWWWIAASFALGAYLMSARAKRKNQVIK